MLTSTNNPRIQRIRKLPSSARNRRKQAAFIVEGVRLLEELYMAGWQPEFVLFTEGINDRAQQIVNQFRLLDVEVLAVDPKVMQFASDTQTPQGILAVLAIPQMELIQDPTFLLILDGIRDPGNLGTLLRTALAAGVDAVILPTGSVDPFSPKVVRSGMGAHFRLSILTMSWEELKRQLARLTVFLADSARGQLYFEAGFKMPLALIVGGEAQGAGSQAAKLAAQHVHIPMPGKIESLNAAVAGAILIFEIVRQRGR